MLMTARLRKLALTAHLTSSVGLLGSIAAFLVLAIAGLLAEDPQIVRAVYPAMDLLAKFIIVPLAVTALGTGLIQSLGTAWGLFRHYWIVVKLLLTAFATAVLLAKLELIGYAAHIATAGDLPRDELRMVGLQLVVHAAGGLLVLLVPAILSVYKPKGLTAYGRRMQQAQRLPLQVPRLQQADTAVPAMSSGLVTIQLRYRHMAYAIAVALVLHILILHAAGATVAWH